MSRPRTNPEDAAREAFKREIKARPAYLDVTQRELADTIGVVPSVMSVLLNNPDKISVGRLRLIIRRLDVSPLIILALLGYTPKEIKDLQQRASE